MKTRVEENGLQEAYHILGALGRTFNLLGGRYVPFQVVLLERNAPGPFHTENG